MYRAVIFDLDGTLVQTEKLKAISYAKAVAEQPARPPSASHATPAVRRFARDLGVDLAKVGGTGRKGRIVREDVTRYVKSELTRTAPA